MIVSYAFEALFALIILVGVVVGGITGTQEVLRRIEQRDREHRARLDKGPGKEIPSANDPICACKHHLSFHKAVTMERGRGGTCAVSNCACQGFIHHAVTMEPDPEPLKSAFSLPREVMALAERLNGMEETQRKAIMRGASNGDTHEVSVGGRVLDMNKDW